VAYDGVGVAAAAVDEFDAATGRHVLIKAADDGELRDPLGTGRAGGG